MRIHVIGAILGVVFDDEDRGVIPVSTMRHGLHHPPDSKIVVSHGRAGLGFARRRAVGVIVG